MLMKKLLTLAAMLMLTMGISAQEKKGWLFYEGLSEETIANLNADTQHWADNGNTDGVIYNWKNVGKQAADSYWMANGEVIEELRGLLIDIGSNKDNSIHLQTARNGGDGKIRLTRKSTKITFPKLANGQKITIQGRSANGTATNRGIAPVQDYLQFQADESSSLYNGACIFVGNSVEGSEGTYTFVWKVVTDQPDSVDVQFQLTPDAGIDFTYFMIDNGDAPDVKDAQPVGYIYNGDLDSDYAYIYLSGDQRFDITEINAAETTATADSLQKFQAIVVSPTIAADDSYLPVIKQAIAFVPTLNFNPYLYEAMGYGTAFESASNVLSVNKADFGAFEGFDVEQPIELLSDGNITAVELGNYFAKDDIVAYAGDPEEKVVAMHVHNIKRNAYLLLPLTLEQMAGANQDVIATLIPQALQTVAGTKKDVTAVGTPSITARQEDGYTVVSISAANGNAIYYTLDGTEPTTESTRYTEPFTLTEPATVKAFAKGDGYSDSKVAVKDVVIMVKAAAPVVSVAREDGKSTVTISGASEGATLYYNFTGSTTLTEAKAYTQPLEFTQPATIYAFANGGDYLTSDVTSLFVGVDGIDKNTLRWDIAAHFDANADEWKGKGQQTDADGTIINANYFFTWGKDAGQYWDPESETTVTGSDGNDSIVYTRTLPAEVYEAGGWRIKSIGQVMVWESLDLKSDIGDTSYRNPDDAEDQIGANDSIGITRDALTFGKQPSGGPFNASLESTTKYAGPFNVVIYAGNGNDGEIPTMQVETSDDGDNWTKLGDVAYSLIRRNYKRTLLCYEGTDEVYVRILHTKAKSSGQLYDLYVMKNGPYSQQVSEEQQGITTVQPGAGIVRTEVFTLGGTRTTQAAKGITIVRQTYADGTVVSRKVAVK